MLKLRDITKIYKTGNLRVEALRGVSLNFERGEFVAVLGPSGCGKTTLLNIIGGLDRYDAGDLSILGRSTKDFSERDMDAYRNNAVGFVFQSYNLIPHQSVLANVELALTLSGIAKSERRKRAVLALEQVGLSDQLHKKPNQLSGGQMQRVAIARALVNDPEVILADEPTGALDSQTGVAVLELLKQLSGERLVIMVTHNRELAERYATRIVELHDGRVAGDSKPLAGDSPAAPGDRLRKTAMGLRTALSLSFNNLLTKRGRTFITALAGSIGIIGIALILSLSNGVNQYIINIQKETMSSYPLVIREQTVQMEEMMGAMREIHENKAEHALDAVYVNSEATRSMEQFQTSVSKNNLTAFKAYLEKEDSPLAPYLSDIRYDYNTAFDLFAIDATGELVDVSGGGFDAWLPEAFSAMMPFSVSPLTEMSPASGDGLVGNAVKDSYTLVAGSWPQKAEDLVIILDSNNEISDMVLYGLGVLPQQELRALMMGQAPDTDKQRVFSYEELLGRRFHVLASADSYLKGEGGGFRSVREDSLAMKALAEAAPLLTTVGIVRTKDDKSFTQGGLGYTRALTDLVIARADNSEIVKAQRQSPQKDVVSALWFAPGDDAQKAENTRNYLASLTPAQKASFAQQAYSFLPELNPGAGKGEGASDTGRPEGFGLAGLASMMEAFTGKDGTQPESEPGPSGFGGFGAGLPGMLGSGFISEMMSGFGDEQLAGLLDAYVKTADDASLARLYDAMIAPGASNLAAALSKLGVVDRGTPSGISLYTETFENKDRIISLIAEYNEAVPEKDRIIYTDYVALMISGVTTIINVISYVLIAFVAVSLVVSSIMIGIITYISVLERIKEIGILRAVGASRKDVRRVFTAEAFIIGLAAGILGIALSLLLLLPINLIIRQLAGDPNVKAILPLSGGLILIAISALLSLLAGWLPARIAAKKDPVEALRTE